MNLTGHLLAISALFFLPRVQAQTFTNQIFNIKFTENLTQNVKLHHAGAIVGNLLEVDENGRFNLQMDIALEGVIQTQITASTGWALNIDNPNGRVFHTNGTLGDNPFYTTGDRSDKLTYTSLFRGKDLTVEKVSFKIVPDLGLLSVKAAGGWVATSYNGSLSAAAGQLILAPSYLREETGPITYTATVSFSLTTANVVVLSSTGLMQVMGEVVSKPATDPELGTTNIVKIGIVGASPPSLSLAP